jgi:hypothetical protein
MVSLGIRYSEAKKLISVRTTEYNEGLLFFKAL